MLPVLAEMRELVTTIRIQERVGGTLWDRTFRPPLFNRRSTGTAILEELVGQPRPRRSYHQACPDEEKGSDPPGTTDLENSQGEAGEQ